MTDQPRKSFAEMRRELAERRGRPIEEPAQRRLKSVPVDEDLIPDVHSDRSEDDIEVDNIIDSIDILDAYRRWIGKEVDERTTSRTEGVMVSCPLPGHRDKNPSAWINTDKRSWFCGGCQEGGDVYDLAAIKFGYARPDYKDGKTFHELRKEMAESYGYRFKTVAGTEIIWKEEEAQEAPSGEVDQADGSASPAPEVADTEDHAGNPKDEPATPLTVLHPEDEDDDAAEQINYPTLDWEAIVPKDTFLHKYLVATSHDDSPEEYHFWHGLLAIGHAAGRKVYLSDTRPVYGNLLVCLLGGTGYGKSRSRAWLDEVLDDAVPFRDNGLGTSGVKLVPVPASGENLINQFQHIAWDPSLPRGSAEIRTPVNGIVDYDEFAALLARASRQGSTLQQIVMRFADSASSVSSSSNTGGTLKAVEPFCSITASTQPKAVRRLLNNTHTGSGFLNRWIFVGGPRKKREVIGGVHTSIRVDLKAAIEELKKVHGWAGKEREVQFTDDGLKEFVTFMRTQVFDIQDKDDTDLLTRLDLTMKRLILLFCINEKRETADADVVSRVEPILEYLISCYAILNAEIGITAIREVTDEILRHALRIEGRTGRGITMRDLSKCMARKNYSPELLEKAIKTMVSLDMLEVDKTKGPGRPSLRYKVVG